MKDRKQIQTALAGPVPSVRIPFDAEGNLDEPALQAIVEFCIDAGSQALIITAGDSLFSLLTEQEIGRITQTVIEQARGRTVVAACTGWWNTEKCVDFARYCREVGADILMTIGSNWYPQCLTAETLVTHHTAVARCIPVMVNTGYLNLAGKSTGLEVVRRLAGEVDNVLAAKCDVTGEFDRKAVLLAKDQWTFFSGGGKAFHMELFPYGCQGHMTTFMTFKPVIARNYWQAIERRDLAAAVKVIKRYDYPFFDFISGLPGGFDAAIHGVYELFGLAKRWRRSPFASMDDQSMGKLKEFLEELKIL